MVMLLFGVSPPILAFGESSAKTILHPSTGTKDSVVDRSFNEVVTRKEATNPGLKASETEHAGVLTHHHTVPQVEIDHVILTDDVGIYRTVNALEFLVIISFFSCFHVAHSGFEPLYSAYETGQEPTPVE
jgi:hypothetical protein